MTESQEPPKDFWTQYGETGLSELRWMRSKRLHEYYEFFAIQHFVLQPETQRLQFQAAEDRMEAIQRTLDRRNKFWATVAGFLVALPGAVATASGIVQCHADTRSAIPTTFPASDTSASPELSPLPLGTAATPLESVSVTPSPASRPPSSPTKP